MFSRILSYIFSVRRGHLRDVAGRLGSRSEGVATLQVMHDVADFSGSPHWWEGATGSETASDLVLGLFNQQKLVRGQMRDSGKALLGLMLQLEGAKTRNTCPCLLPEARDGGGVELIL